MKIHFNNTGYICRATKPNNIKHANFLTFQGYKTANSGDVFLTQRANPEELNELLEQKNFTFENKINSQETKIIKDNIAAMNLLEKIAKTGEEMKDYKFWDLVIDGNGYNIIKTDRLIRYTAPTLEKEVDPNRMHFLQTIKIKTDRSTAAGTTTSHLTFEYPNNESAIMAYDKFGKLPEEERYIELTRMLEKQSNQIAEDQKFAQKTLEEKQNFVSDLFKKFGTTSKEI